MSGSAEILAAFRELSNAKQIDRAELHALLQDGIHAALAKKHGPNVQADISIDEGKGEIRIVLLKTVVEKVEDPSREISLEEARYEDAAFQAGDIMEEPVEFSPEAIRTEKIKVLRAISLPNDKAAYAVRGQYDQGWLAGERAVAYRAEDGISGDSKTETYAAVRLGIETRRWAGVPFYMRTGKRLPRRVTEIGVLFKKAPHLPFSRTDTEELGHNQLVIRVQPDEGVTLKFGSKVPGTSMEVRDVAMDFLYGEAFTEASPEAYERLILDVLIGDATLFPRNDEVEASWRVIDPLEQFWDGQQPHLYRAGEWGPMEADEMLARDGRTWRRP